MTIDHLDSDQVAAYATGRLIDSERSVVEAHLADCALCRQEVAEVRPLLLRRRVRPSRIAAGVAAAAAVVALVFLPARPVDDRAETEPVLRPGGDAEDLTILAAWSPVPDGAVTRPGLRFVWGADGPDALYEITVTDSAGTPVWRVRTPDTTLAPPDTLSFVAGATYHWWVDVLLRDARMATTGVHGFSIIR